MFSETIFYYFVFIKYSCKKYTIPKLSTKTCKDKINYYHSLKT